MPIDEPPPIGEVELFPQVVPRLPQGDAVPLEVLVTVDSADIISAAISAIERLSTMYFCQRTLFDLNSGTC